MESISQGANIECRRFRILLSISDQDSAYEKMGKHISETLADYLENETEFLYPFFHIHDIGHQVKNAQASLERGTQFDGTNIYDATNLTLIMSTGTNEVTEKMNKGVAHGTLAQLDKHSDEHALQRISEPVTEACKAMDKVIRTDIPELRRPWFADNHNEIISPLFLAVSKYGVVFYTDESKNTVSFYRQTPLPRKIHIVSGGEGEGDDDNVPLAPQKVSCKSAKWKTIASLAFIDSQTKIIVVDTKLPSVRLISGIKQLWRSPNKNLDRCRLEIQGQPRVFHPFAVKTKNDNSRRLLLTDPTASVIYLAEISEEWTSMRILRNIKADGIRYPVSCYPYSQDTLIVTDVDQQSPAVHFVTIEEEEARKLFFFENNHFSFKLPFDICELNGSVFVTDNERHCVFNLDVEAGSMAPVIGMYNDAGEEDGPIEIAKLSHPNGIAVRGSVIYVAEHPREYQGAVRVMYSLQGLVSFQTIWRGIAYSMGLISKRSTANDTELAKAVKTRKLRESHDKLQAPAEQLKCLIESTIEHT